MYQQPAVARSTEDAATKLGELRAKANVLELQVADLISQRSQLAEQRNGLPAGAQRSAVDKQIADAERGLTETQVQLERTKLQIDQLQFDRDVARSFKLQGPVGTTQTAQPPLGPFGLAVQTQDVAAIGGFFLMLPIVAALTRRLWRRGTVTRMDTENTARLQRMEQAIESIAIEVERIGEAQRFTTKLLAERQPDAMPRVPAARKEPGVITPH